MVVVALEICAGLVIAAGSVLGLRYGLARRLDRATGGPDDGARERADALRQISREIDRGKAARGGFY